jgi:hypothetical protein
MDFDFSNNVFEPVTQSVWFWNVRLYTWYAIVLYIAYNSEAQTQIAFRLLFHKAILSLLYIYCWQPQQRLLGKNLIIFYLLSLLQ